jgi:UDP-glucose 4-epimerase
MDLARAHADAIDSLSRTGRAFTVNIGTGQGHSVLELLRAFEKVSGRTIPFEIKPRRPGDVARCYADPALAFDLMGWRSRFDLERMCRDAWRWQQANPDGYA